MISNFLIFGATGDLTSRYLLPALGQLYEHDKLPSDFVITGVSYEDKTTESFREWMAQSLETKAPEVPEKTRKALVEHIRYCRADVRDKEQMKAALKGIEGPLVAYLALPPRFFAPAVEALAEAALPEGSRIVIEKPFGQDLASAQHLNEMLHESFEEEDVFRLDHFLGRQTVQNVLGLRFANCVFEPVWNRQHVARVEIIWDETLALEGRAGYYDSTGALKDMLQNHLLQLMVLVAMEAPISLGVRDFRDRKVDVLRAVRKLKPEEVKHMTVRGRYTAGRIEDRDIPSYAEEKGVDASRQTETFAQVVLFVDNWRWAGVPFLLRSGKALGERKKQIAIHFQDVPYLAFCDEVPEPNVLRLQIGPDQMRMNVNINGIGDPFGLESVDLVTQLAPQDLSAYARLLLEITQGEPQFTIRDDEAEESWRIIEPILEGWKANKTPLVEYPAGSSGPSTAGELYPLSGSVRRSC